MSNAVKKAILQKKVEGVITDLMVKTSAENVVVDDAGKTLSAELAEIITAMAGKATASDIDTRINALIEERREAKKAKNFARADEIRKSLLDEGIVLMDGPQGTTWRRI